MAVVEQRLVVLPEAIRKQVMQPGALEKQARVKVFPAQRPLWQRLGDIDAIDEMLTSVGSVLKARFATMLSVEPHLRLDAHISESAKF